MGFFSYIFIYYRDVFVVLFIVDVYVLKDDLVFLDISDVFLIVF